MGETSTTISNINVQDYTGNTDNSVQKSETPEISSLNESPRTIDGFDLPENTQMTTTEGLHEVPVFSESEVVCEDISIASYDTDKRHESPKSQDTMLEDSYENSKKDIDTSATTGKKKKKQRKKGNKAINNKENEISPQKKILSTTFTTETEDHEIVETDNVMQTPETTDRSKSVDEIDILQDTRNSGENADEGQNNEESKDIDETSVSTDEKINKRKKKRKQGSDKEKNETIITVTEVANIMEETEAECVTMNPGDVQEKSHAADSSEVREENNTMDSFEGTNSSKSGQLLETSYSSESANTFETTEVSAKEPIYQSSPRIFEGSVVTENTLVSEAEIFVQMDDPENNLHDDGINHENMSEDDFISKIDSKS